LKRKKITENRKHPSIHTNQKQAEERVKTRCKNKAATSETDTEPLPTPKKEEETLEKEALEKKKKTLCTKMPKKFRRGRWRKDKGVERNLARKKIKTRAERVVVALLSLLAPCSPGAALCVLPTQGGRQVPGFVIPCAHSTPEPFIDAFRCAERRLFPRAHILHIFHIFH